MIFLCVVLPSKVSLG